MTPRRSGITRVGGAVALVAAVVAAAPALGGPIQLAAPPASPGASRPTTTIEPVRHTVLACSGSETDGISGLAPVPAGVTTVLAASAPAEALVGVATAAGEGSLAMRSQPADTSVDSGTTRGRALRGTLTGATIAEVTGTGPLAVGVAALQTTLHATGDDRGLSSSACQAPRAELWLLAGGGDSTRRERLIVANPGANPVTVDVVAYGGSGRIQSTTGSRLAVPPHGRVGVLVDAIAPGEATPAVQVSATGGVVTAVLEDAWIEGAIGRGRDDVGPSAQPATDQVIPAVVLAGRGLVRLLATGAGEAVVQARVLTESGPLPLPGGGVLRVPGGAVRDLDLGGLAPGAYAVHVKSDVPVVAAAMVERRPADGTVTSGSSDLAWVAASPPIPVIAGTPIPTIPSSSPWLMVVGTAAPWAATVFVVGGDGAVTTTPVSGQADTVALVALGTATAVWVRPSAGTVRAGVSIEVSAPEGPLVSLVPLTPLAVTSTDIPIRQVRR